MLARMFEFTKGRCNFGMPGARCPCATGRCTFDPNGAGDVESIKCHACSHRMWDHRDLVGGALDVERGIVIGDPPPYDEGSRRNGPGHPHPHPFTDTANTPEQLPTEPAQSHNHSHFYHGRRNEPARYDAPLATSRSSPRGTTDPPPQFDAAMRRQQAPLRPGRPGRACTANVLVGAVLGVVVVATPVIAYRVVTS